MHWKGKKGDARVELYRGDCLDLLKRVPDGSVDLVLSDPPYGVTNLAWDTRLPTDRLWAEYRRVVKADGVVVLFAQQPYATELIAGAPRGWFRYEWIWNKKSVTDFGNAKRRPLRQHENILVFYGGTAVYHPQGLKALGMVRRRRPTGTDVYGRGLSTGGVQRWTNYPRSILEFPRGRVERPCQKPVGLLAYLVLTYTKAGAVVLDNSMGTGTTGVAAVVTGRSFIGMEKDRRAYAGAKAKIREAMRRG